MATRKTSTKAAPVSYVVDVEAVVANVKKHLGATRAAYAARIEWLVSDYPFKETDAIRNEYRAALRMGYAFDKYADQNGVSFEEAQAVVLRDWDGAAVEGHKFFALYNSANMQTSRDIRKAYDAFNAKIEKKEDRVGLLVFGSDAALETTVRDMMNGALRGRSAA